MVSRSLWICCCLSQPCSLHNTDTERILFCRIQPLILHKALEITVLSFEVAKRFQGDFFIHRSSIQVLLKFAIIPPLQGLAITIWVWKTSSQRRSNHFILRLLQINLKQTCCFHIRGNISTKCFSLCLT